MEKPSPTDRIERVEIVVTDVDGVLTDGGMFYSETGDELKKFNVRDGMGVALLQAAGMKVGAITGESAALIKRRLDKIGMDFSYLGVKNKRTCMTEVLERFDCDSHAVAYIGDELNDQPIFGEVGVFLAPADACEFVRARADHVLRANGGKGVLREAAEFLLREAGAYDRAVEIYTRGLLGAG